MAGVAFALRKLVQRDDLFSNAAGYFLAGFVSTGPWLFTVVALLAVEQLAGRSDADVETTVFRGILVYNFAFSLVFTAPLVMITTRYVADCVYIQAHEPVPGALLMSLSVVLVSSIVMAGAYYGWVVELPTEMRIAAVINYCLIASMWVVSVFLSVLRGYILYAATFCIGISAAAFAAIQLGYTYGSVGLLIGMNLGLAGTLFALLGWTLASFPFRFAYPPAFMRYMYRFSDLALYGFLGALALWVDKWVMWFAPEAAEVVRGMVFFYEYDNAMFLVYLTIVPGLAYIFLSVETGLEEHIRTYLSAVNGEATWTQLEKTRVALGRFIADRLRTLILVQGTLSIVVAGMGPQILTALGASYTQVGIFRIGVLAAFFHVLILFLAAVFTYLDLRRVNVTLQGLLVVLSALGTALSLQFGFASYGLGYLVATMIVWVAAYLWLRRVVNNLPYYSFVVVNAANARSDRRGPNLAVGKW